MSLTIGIIGIDGSGKSTLTPNLANLAAAEFRVTTAAIGDGVWLKSPEEDLSAPGFAPDGELLTARLGRLFQRAAKSATAHRRLYPPLKLAHLAMQEWTARQIAHHHRPDVIFCEGSLLLSAAGRAVNYMDPRAVASAYASSTDPLSHIEALYAYVMEGKPLPPETVQAIPGLKMMRRLRRLDAGLKLGVMRLPDAVVFLDIAPEAALARLTASGHRLDPHENLYDLAQARTMYQSSVAFFRHRLGEDRTAVIDVTRLSIEHTLRRILAFVRRLIIIPPNNPPVERGQLGMAGVDLTRASAVARKTLTYRYLAGYALPNFHRGGAYELTFPFSRLGRQFLREGYSAETMSVIYLQGERRYGLLDRAFLKYPLHRAVYHRLRILNPWVERELRQRLEWLPHGDTLKILTAPSGYAFDVLQPLARIAAFDRDQLKTVHILASDLDRTGRIERGLRRAAHDVGAQLEFVRGDMTLAATTAQFKASGPYDVVVFVGLSSWMAKPHLLEYLRLIRRHLLKPGGALFADCFTPGTFALSGKYLGYNANYYSPREFTGILAYCGFDPAQVVWKSGPEAVNHVCRATYLADATDRLLSATDAAATHWTVRAH